MKRNLHVVIVAAAGIAVLAWAGAFAPQAVGQAPPGFAAGTESGFATFQTRCAAVPRQSERSNARRRRRRMREMPPEKIYDALASGTMQAQAARPDRRAEEARRRVHEPAARSAARNRVTPRTWPISARTQSAADRSGTGRGLERLGSDLANTRFQPAQAAGLTAAQVPRLKLKWAFGYPTGVSANAPADDRVGTRVRRQRQRLRLFARRRDRLRLLVVRERIDRPQRADRGAGHRARATRGTPSTSATARPTSSRSNAQNGKLLWKTKADPHFIARITAGAAVRRQAVRPGLVVRGVQQRQSRLSLLLVARQRRGARCQHREGDLESLGRARGAEAVQDAGQRRGALQAGRRRGLEFADGRSGPAGGLLRHRRRDDGAVAEDDGRHHGGRHQHRQAAVVVSGDRERRVHGRLQRPGQERSLPDPAGARHGHRQLADPQDAAERQARADHRHQGRRRVRARSRQQRRAALPDQRARAARSAAAAAAAARSSGAARPTISSCTTASAARDSRPCARRPAKACGLLHAPPPAGGGRGAASSARRRRRSPASCSRARPTASCTRCPPRTASCSGSSTPPRSSRRSTRCPPTAAPSARRAPSSSTGWSSSVRLRRRQRRVGRQRAARVRRRLESASLFLVRPLLAPRVL